MAEPRIILHETGKAFAEGAVERELPLIERLWASPVLRKSLLLIGLAIIWEIYARFLDNPLLFPTLTETLQAMVERTRDGTLPMRAWTSLRILLMGYAAGILLAAIMTVLAISTRIGTDLLETLTAMFNPLPAIALLPLALIWFGLGSGSLVFVLIHSVLWAVALNTHAGFLGVSQTLRMVGKNYGLKGLPYVFRILVPAAFPSILTGLKIGWAFAWRTLIAAELVFGVSSGQGGLGWFIFENRNVLDIPAVFAGLLTVIVIGLVVENLVFRVIERRTVRRAGASNLEEYRVMLNLLVPTEPHEVMPSVLQTALLCQKRFESYVESFALRPAIPDYVPIDMVSGLAWHVDEKADEDARRESHAMFTKFAEFNELPAARPGVVEPGWGWHPKAPAGDAFLASHARIFDLTILGRPVSGKAVPSMATLEAALFESGRPILIAPPTSPTTIGDTVVIAWNGSSETARTVAYAGPFLRKAKQILVLTIEGWTTQGPTGEQLAMSLRRNEVAAEAIHVAPGRRSMGETILEETTARGGDLLLKGAYTQSRLRQMIFGGATAHVLAAADVPVFMAN